MTETEKLYDVTVIDLDGGTWHLQAIPASELAKHVKTGAWLAFNIRETGK